MSKETNKFKCEICGREFNSLRSLKSHIGHHVRKGEVETSRGLSSTKKFYPDKIKKKIHNSISYNESGEKIYTCECGREFSNKQSYVAHTGHCEIHLGYKPKKRGTNVHDWWNNLKLEDPDKYHELHSKAGRAGAEASKKNNGGEYPVVTFSKTPSEERDNAHKKQSETRKERIKNGIYDLPKGSGRSYGSYFRGIFLRSTYEAIYVVYLEYYGIKWKYESERIIYNNKLHISDFKFHDNHIVEIKGIEKDGPKVCEAFLSKGYSITCLGPKIINNIKLHLRKLGINIDELITNIISSRKEKKEYLNWNFINNNITYN